MVRTSPNEVSFINAQAWKDIYGHATKGTAGGAPHKHWDRFGSAFNNEADIFRARDEDHNRMRRIFAPGFSDRALKLQEPLLLKYTNLLEAKLREGIEKDSDHKFDMVNMYNFTTFDVMADLAFSEPLHMLANAEYDPWVKLIFESIRMIVVVDLIKRFPLVFKVFTAIMPTLMDKKREEHFQNSVDRVTKRIEKGKDFEHRDISSLVLNQPEGKGMTRGEMDANSDVIMLAEIETTATLVSGLTYLLLKNPKKMELLTSEIRTAFASTGDMTMEKTAALPYLNACIKEAFRMYPPVGMGMVRQTPPEGSTICGYFVAPGVSILVHLNTAHTTYRCTDCRKHITTALFHVGKKFQGTDVFSAGALAWR